MFTRGVRLPLQNIFAIAALLFAGESAVVFLIPGDRGAGWHWALSGAFWAMAVWVCRMAAKLVLRGQRKARFYGLTMIAVSAFLSMAIEALVLSGRQSVALFLTVRFVSTFVLLLMAAPWFIRKEEFSTLLSSSEKP